jgi:SAM-dependent methyltransferase
LYSSSFYSQFEESLYGDPDIARYRVANIGTPKVKYVEERLGRVGAWLDIGCGTGEVLYAAKPRGWSVQGIETNERAAEIGRSMFGIPITTKFVTEADGAQLVENFDVISMFGVLEHIYNPNAVLATIVQHMKDDAALVLEVPHYPSISCFSQMAFPGLVNRILTPPMHLMIFSLGAMKALLDRHGLAVSHVWYYGQDFYEWVTTLMETSTVEDNTIFDQLLEMTSEFQAVIDKHHLSDEMLVIAKKRDVAS